MLRSALLLLLLLATANAFAGEVITTAAGDYQINPGDVLEIYIWNEKDLTREVLVRPDGFISMPLAGQILAGGQTVSNIQEKVSSTLGQYLKDKPSVTVSLRQSNGFKIYVLGKVNRPGEYPINRPTDVMQALSLAGGLNAFAAENDINVLHRAADGTQKATRFRYSDVKNGESLNSNLVLNSGDIVVVP